MKRNVAIAAEASNLVGAETGPKLAQSGTIQRAINDVLRANFKRKTWASLQLLVGCEERVAKHRLAGTRQYDQVEVFLLLGSSLGREIQKAVFKALGIDPGWLDDYERALKRAHLISEIQQLTLDLQESKDIEIVAAATKSAAALSKLKKPKR